VFTEYEHKASLETELWKKRPPGKVARALGLLNKPLEKPVGWLMDRTVVGKVLEGVLQVAMDGASWSVADSRVVDHYRQHGFEISTIEDVRTKVPMEAMDRHALLIGKRYRLTAGVEGGAAGAGALAGPQAGAAALAADLVALTGLSCRCVAHYAAVYGFRVDEPHQRAMAMRVLVGATSADMAAKETALLELRAVALMVAKKKTWSELEKSALVKAVQEAAERMSINLTKAKLGQVVAVLGMLVGSGFNSWYLTKVSEWSYYTYRELHLKDKREPSDDRSDDDESIDGEAIEDRNVEIARPVFTAADNIPPAVRNAFQAWDERGRPPQAPTGWQRDRWLAAMPQAAPLLSELPDKLDRGFVRGAVLGRPVTAAGMFEALIIVYAWGWSTTAVGVTRAQRTLQGGAELVGSALLAAREGVISGGPLDGYAALAGPHRIPGLGPSFGTKFLYLVSPEQSRALILDELVATWLDRAGALSLSPTNWSRRGYSTYTTSMCNWANHFGIAAHLLEEIFFTEEATRRGLASWGIREPEA
jgi:hypothetical protein